MVTSAVAGAFLLVRVTSTESLFGFSLDGVGTGNKGKGNDTDVDQRQDALALYAGPQLISVNGLGNNVGSFTFIKVG